ncbi:MAG: hypothetical protein R3E58_10100 [Phycisphaerae bacterium]
MRAEIIGSVRHRQCPQLFAHYPRLCTIAKTAARRDWDGLGYASMMDDKSVSISGVLAESATPSAVLARKQMTTRIPFEFLFWIIS